MEQWLTMPKRQPPPTSIAMDAFVRNAAWTIEGIGLKKEAEFVTMVKKRSPRSVSQKTINNALKGRHNGKIGTYDSLAVALGVPLWVLFIPTLKASDLQSPNRERLVALVENYLRCGDEGRHHTETMAAGFAAKAGLS